jgi:archaemetzincin
MTLRAALLFALCVLTACGRSGPESAAPLPQAAAEPVAANEAAFTPLGPPGDSDWRAAHPDEHEMSFEDYTASEPVRADAERPVLAFLPVGPFDEGKRATLEAAVAFADIWFQIPTRTLPSAPLTGDEDQFRIRDDAYGGAERRQYRTKWFLNDVLPNALPADAVVLVGVTMADIWPGAGWNFVFGEADLRRRVGVYSLARYYPEFCGGTSTPKSDRLALLRTLKVVVHEVGHTFGLEHCTEFACAMNGSNSMDETDRAPLHLCSTCLAKLAWNRGFDADKRYRELAAFLDAHGLGEDAAWCRARVGSAR